MATEYNIGTTSVGVGGNTPLRFDPTGGVHSGSWFGLPDFGLTEMAQGQQYTTTTPGVTQVTPEVLSTQNRITQPTLSPIQQQAQSSGFDMKYYPGWDPAAAQADWVATGGSKANTGGGSTGGGTTTTKQNNITTVSTAKGSDVAADYANYADQMSPDQYYAMIDQEAGNSMNFLNQQEASIRADQPGIEQGITAQADLLKNKAGTQKEDAQSAARRLYSELQQGYRQKFGGASSAGEAAQALTNNEQQRQMAQNNRTYQEAVSQVDLSATQAVQSAQSEFRNQLLEIGKNRTAVESERLAARRQALSDLSQKVFAIQQQRETFKQNLQLMQEQARLANTNQINSMSTNPTSGLTMNGMNTQASGNQGLNTAVGSINNTSSGMAKNDDSLLASKGIFPRQSLRDGRIMYSDGIAR